MGENRCVGDDGYPLVDLDSDDDCRAESSDDELDVILHGTPEQKRRLRRLSLGLQSSSEDEFEKEMADELDDTMATIKNKHLTGAEQSNIIQGPQNRVYDSNYFDSDSDDEESSQEKSRKHHPVISNDELLYDPNIDDDNQNWVDRQRQRYQPSVPPGHRSQGMPPKTSHPKVKRLPHSDAVLNCPACMTVLCLDCQRHASYKNQYRAMFVMNCDVERGELLRFPQQKQSKKSQKNNKKRNKKQKTESMNNAEILEPCEGNSAEPSGSGNMSADPSGSGHVTTETGSVEQTGDRFNPVKCVICKTEVGVYDTDEVYHFFNVLASYS